jgi:transposase
VLGRTGDSAEIRKDRDAAEFFTDDYAALLAAMLDRIGRVNAEIARLTEVIDRLLAPYEEQLQQAESMPGRGR